MELLGCREPDYLLDAPLQSLHKESVVWLKQLQFWTGEMSFFYKLLHRPGFFDAFPSAEVAELDKALVKLNSEGLEKVRGGLRVHGRHLASILRAPSVVDERLYRESHRRLLIDMGDLLEDVGAFKKRLFSFVEGQS